MPVIVKAYTGDWKVLDNNSNLGLNPLTVIQRTLLGDRVTDGVEAEITAATVSLEGQLKTTLEPLIEVFN